MNRYKVTLKFERNHPLRGYVELGQRSMDGYFLSSKEAETMLLPKMKANEPTMRRVIEVRVENLDSWWSRLKRMFQ